MPAMKSKNILYIFAAPTASGYAGGVITIISNMLEEVELFKRYGYTLEYFDSNVRDPRQPLNKALERVPIKLWQQILRSRRMLLGVTKYLDRSADKYDLLHFHSSRKWVLLRDLIMICRLKKHKPVTIVLTLHFAEADKILFSNRLVKKFMLYVLRTCVDKIIFLSEMTRQEFNALDIPSSKTSVIYTFHNIDMDQNKGKLLRKTEAGGKLDKDKVNLLFMGSIDERKGIFDLLEAVEICRRKADVTLHICGKAVDTNIERSFQEKMKSARTAIEYHGYVSGDQKLSVLNKADILILPSYGEGMPLVIMEAMACGCGMIVTDVGAICEIVKEPDNAIIIKPGDIAGLSGAIDRLVEDRDLLNTMKLNNLTKARQYTVHYYVQENCALYDELLAAPRN